MAMDAELLFFIGLPGQKNRFGQETVNPGVAL
jgi:hypothetical protein